jgi:hypothetical protein
MRRFEKIFVPLHAFLANLELLSYLFIYLFNKWQ